MSSLTRITAVRGEARQLAAVCSVNNQKHTYDTAKDRTRDAVKNATRKTRETAEKESDAASGAADAATDAAHTIKEKVKNATSAIKDYMDSSKGKMRETANIMEDTAGEYVDPAVRDSMKSMYEKAKDVYEKAKDAKGGVKSKASEMGHRIKDSAVEKDERMNPDFVLKNLKDAPETGSTINPDYDERGQTSVSKNRKLENEMSDDQYILKDAPRDTTRSVEEMARKVRDSAVEKDEIMNPDLSLKNLKDAPETGPMRDPDYGGSGQKKECPGKSQDPEMDNKMHNDGYTLKDAARDTTSSTDETARTMGGQWNEPTEQGKRSWHKGDEKEPKTKY